MQKVRGDLVLIILVLTALVVVLAPASSASGQRLVAEIEEPFEVNGKLFAAGTLSLREVAYSPVVTLNEIWVNGECLGIMLGEKDNSAAVAKIDEMIFTRVVDGHLVLVAVAIQGSAPRELHRFSGAPDREEPLRLAMMK